jgi:hypothetical protein
VIFYCWDKLQYYCAFGRVHHFYIVCTVLVFSSCTGLMCFYLPILVGDHDSVTACGLIDDTRQMDPQENLEEEEDDGATLTENDSSGKQSPMSFTSEDTQVSITH